MTTDINTMELACDLAEWAGQFNDDDYYNENDCGYFTEEAQDRFNHLYDEMTSRIEEILHESPQLSALEIIQLITAHVGD